jgi:hypothetical protein
VQVKAQNPIFERHKFIHQLVSELSLPGQGNSFLVIERQDRRESYAQAARTADNDYVAEYRDGDSARHFAAPHLTMPEAQAALCGWAFNLPGWPDQFTWARVPPGGTAAAETGSTADPGPARSRGGTWAPAGAAHDEAAPVSTPPVKAADPSTAEAPKAPERREQADAAPRPASRRRIRPGRVEFSRPGTWASRRASSADAAPAGPGSSRGPQASCSSG